MDNKRNHNVVISALLTGLLTGIASILIDLDHVPFIAGIMEEGRPLHLAFLFIGCFGVSCFGGFILGSILSLKRVASRAHKCQL